MNFKKVLTMVLGISMALIILLMPLLSAGCGGGEEKTLKVGLSICYTGPVAWKGKPMGDGKLDCIEYINTELGGVKGYKIEAIWRDNQYDGGKATTIVNELINSGCLIFTTCSSAMMTASSEIANRNEYPGIAVFSSPALTNPPRHIYAQMPDYGDDWAAFAQYYLDNIWKGEGRPKMAMHLLNNPTGAGALAAAKLLADKMGIDLLPSEEHAAATISEIESLTRIKALNPDVLFISSTPGETATIVKNCVELGMYPGMTIACAHASFTSVLVELAGENAEGVYGVYPTVNWGDNVPAMAKMTEYCNKNHPDDYGNNDYITTWAESLILAEILRLALEHVDNDPDKLTPQIVEEYGIKKLNNFAVGGLHGPVTYTPGDNRLSKSVRVFQVQNGKLIPITGWVEASLIPYKFD